MKLFHLVTTTQSLCFLEGQAKFMLDQGIDVHVVCSPGQEVSEFRRSEHVITHEIVMTRSISPWRDFLSLLQLVALFRRERPDIVHVHTPKASLLGMIAAWGARVPCRIFHIHGLPHSTATGLKRFILRWSTKVPASLATRVICVSNSVSASAVDEYICQREKVTVFGKGSINGVDALERFIPAKRSGTRREQRLGITSNDLAIGFVGRLARDKGLCELHESWLTIRREFPNTYLVLAGTPDDRDPTPIRILDSFASDERVRMLGWVKDTAEAYSLLDILVLPSYREGLGMVILEAGAMQVPSVATRVVGCMDAVVDGVTGLLVNARDTAQLVQALRTYLTNPDLRDRHGHVARERVLNDFRPENVWSLTLQAYQAAVNRTSVEAMATVCEESVR